MTPTALFVLLATIAGLSDDGTVKFFISFNITIIDH